MCHLPTLATLAGMSTTELLEQVRALPARERQKFVVRVLALQERVPAAQSTPAKPIRWPDVEARARRIFGKTKLPNLVLLEREEDPACGV